MKVMPFLAMGAVMWLTGCAIQQDMAILEDRVMALERQNRELQDQIQGELSNLGQSNQSAEKNIRSQYAGMNVTIETMQQDMRLLSGRIEEVEHSVSGKMGAMTTGSRGPERTERLDEINLSLARIDQRVTLIEQSLNMDRKSGVVAPPPPPPAAVSQPRQSSAVVPTVNMYDQAKQSFDNGEWDASRRLFQQFIKAQPNSENADNAQFWIGESYYNEQWFEKAILEYQTVIEKYPTGNKVASAMLKQGLAFLKLGDQSNARLILKDLQKKFPQSNEAGIASAKLKEF